MAPGLLMPSATASPSSDKQMRLRFSLRTLFVATTIAAAGCCEFVLPSVNARRFIEALAAKHYERADAYFRDANDRFLFEFHDKHWRFVARAKLERWSLRQFLRAERLLILSVAYGDAGPMRSRMFVVVVTRSGLLTPQPTFVGGSFGGGGIAGP
jgi:hypothetical protein